MRVRLTENILGVPKEWGFVKGSVHKVDAPRHKDPYTEGRTYPITCGDNTVYVYSWEYEEVADHE